MRRGRNGKSVYAEVGFWLAKDNSFQIRIKGISTHKIFLFEDTNRISGHRVLFRHLEIALKRMGAPSPALNS
jgi:hypothetical protein